MTDKKLNSQKKSKETKQNLIYNLDKKSDIYKTINERLNSIVGMLDSYGEDIYIQKITPEFLYEERFDFTLPPDVANDKLFPHMGHRMWSIQVSLNNITDGGHLTFHSIDRSVKPVKGEAIIWKNIYHDMSPNPYTKHTHFQTNEGDKYVLFKFYRMADGSQVKKDGQQEIEIQLDEIN
jgi:hypothetical protein